MWWLLVFFIAYQNCSKLNTNNILIGIYYKWEALSRFVKHHGAQQVSIVEHYADENW